MSTSATTIKPAGDGRQSDLWIACLLVLFTTAAFWQIHSHDFVDYDDTAYVTLNDRVKQGLSADNLIWAFTTTHAANWHPLTWLSHMLDVHLYGLHPGGHHLTSLLLHVVNTLLLFVILRRATGAAFESGFAAALFALHPLHVESVAWIAERKDLLCAFFWFLSIIAYIDYVQTARAKSYLAVCICFALGLMAKPMVVTLPFLLLVLDYWPMGRTTIHTGASGGFRARIGRFARLVREKIPLFALSAAGCIITVTAQERGGAIAPMEVYPFTVRLANAVASYSRYLLKTVWPGDLAVLYPHPGMPPWAVTAAAAALMLIVTGLCLKYARTQPWCMAGWLWYVGTLVPVIGLVQVGAQAMADRYTYVPLVGIFIMFSWTGGMLFRRYPGIRPLVAAMALSIVATLAAISWTQIGHWRNTRTLYGHALEATEDNYVIHYNMGVHLTGLGRHREAVEHYRAAIGINSSYGKAHNNWGLSLAALGRIDAAMAHYRQAIQIDPSNGEAHNNMANALMATGRIDEAMAHYQTALSVFPHMPTARMNLGLALLRRGSIREAVDCFRKLLQDHPEMTGARNSLQLAISFQRQLETAAHGFAHAVDAAAAQGGTIASLQDLMEAKAAFYRVADRYVTALSRQPGYTPEEFDPGGIEAFIHAHATYMKLSDLFDRHVRLNPAAATRYHTACIRAAAGQYDAAIHQLGQAADAGFIPPVLLHRDKDLQPLRDLPGFRAVLASVDANRGGTQRNRRRPINRWLGNGDHAGKTIP